MNGKIIKLWPTSSPGYASEFITDILKMTKYLFITDW